MHSKQQKMEQKLYSGNEKPPELEKIQKSFPATFEETMFVPVYTQSSSGVDSAKQVELPTFESSVTREAEPLPVRGNIGAVTETKKSIKWPAGPPGIRRIFEDKKKKKNKAKKRLKGILTDYFNAS